MKKVIHISIDEDLCKELKVAAYEKHFSLSAVINSALKDFNEKLKNDELKQDMKLNVSLKIFKRTRKNKNKKLKTDISGFDDDNFIDNPKDDEIPF